MGKVNRNPTNPVMQHKLRLFGIARCSFFNTSNPVEKTTFPKFTILSSTLFWICLLQPDPEDYFALWGFQAHLWPQSEWIVDCGGLSGNSPDPSPCIYGTLWLWQRGLGCKGHSPWCHEWLWWHWPMASLPSQRWNPEMHHRAWPQGPRSCEEGRFLQQGPLPASITS